MVLCIHDELAHELKEPCDLSGPNCIELILHTNEEHDTKGTATADRAHDRGRIGCINGGVVITTDVVEAGSVDVGETSRRVVMTAEQPRCRDIGVSCRNYRCGVSDENINSNPLAEMPTPLFEGQISYLSHTLESPSVSSSEH